MATQTPNLGLLKAQGSDYIDQTLIDNFGVNWDKIDQEIVKRIVNSGGVPSIQAGLDAEKPAPGTAGRLYIATDTQVIYRDTGSAWQKVGVVNWNDIANKPSTFPAAAHTHSGSDITSAVASAVNADTVDGKHATDFAAASHTHTKSQITDFAHTHVIADITNIANIRTDSTKRLVVEVSNVAPSNPVAGQLWFDSVNKKFKGFDGAAWL